MRPITTLRQAITWARALRLVVVPAVDFHGIKCVSHHAKERWQRATKFGPVDPVGAAILLAQPLATDLEAAALEVLGCQAAYLEGVLAGVANESPAKRYLDLVSRTLAIQGVEDGAILRLFLEVDLDLRNLPREGSA